MEPRREWTGGEVAIIGMAGRFPGASDLQQFWRNLVAGVESVRRLSPRELEPSSFGELPRDSAQFVPVASLLDDVESFDAAFFGYSPHEAEIIDPQQRLLLECGWEALEHAGYDPETYGGAIGVFAGARTNTYLFNLYAQRAALAELDPFQVGLGNDLAFLASRLSFKFDLRGPSYAVHTACSTGLVAVHLARQSLLLDECQMAIAAGVAVNVPQRTGYLFQAGGIVSPDGHTRPFDEQARGTVFGSGLGVVVLKRLAEALADGDTIHAVIRGSATNNDGARKASFTAPSVVGQSEVILEALAEAGVDPATIGYVEAHGTGTALGDPIEVRALARAFGAAPARRASCALGSVKSNLGHLDAAAGVASLLKAVLALEHGQIPPSLHFERPSPQIDFAATPFYVADRLLEWPPASHPRRAAVSSFGIGGTNAHLILEQAPPAAPPRRGRPWHLLTLAARSEAALASATSRLASHLGDHPELDLAAVAHTLLAGRKAFAYRRSVVCRDLADAASILAAPDAARFSEGYLEEGERPLAFLFTGQGGALAGAGAGLYRDEAVFRQALDQYAEHLGSRLGHDLRDLLFAHGPAAEARLARTALAQPALVALELALVRLLDSWGARPAAVLGHSVGELAAAAAAGVLRWQDVLDLAAERGRLVQDCPPGAMLAVALAPAALAPLLDAAGGAITAAALNAFDLTVVAGRGAAISALEAQLSAQGVEHRRLLADHAFHSPLIEGAMAGLAARMTHIELRPPAIPWLSSLTAAWMSPEEAVDPGYFCRQLRQPVRFADALTTLLAEPTHALVEVGPGSALCRLSRRHPRCARHRVVVACLPRRASRAAEADGGTGTGGGDAQGEEERRELLAAVGRLWVAGVPFDSRLFAPEERRRVPLPSYPFERQRYWIDGAREVAAGAIAAGKQAEVAAWFHAPTWRRTLPPAPRVAAAAPVLIFLDALGLGARLAELLERQGRPVVRVAAAERFERLGAACYSVAPDAPEDYRALVAALQAAGEAPRLVAHLFSLTGHPTGEGPAPARFAAAQRLGYYSLLFAAQALLAAVPEPLRFVVGADRLLAVAPDEPLAPEKAPLLGPCRVLPQENPRLRCLPVDLAPPAAEAAGELAAQLAAELAGEDAELAVAYRAGRRYVLDFQPLPIGEGQAGVRPLRHGGVYLITGGLGGVGLLLAEYLATRYRARLVLTGRTPLPPQREWEGLLTAASAEPLVLARVRRLQALQAAGAELLVAAADVADEEAMRQLVGRAEDRFGALHGVVHAAGVTSGASLYRAAVEIGAEESEVQFRPKAHGLYALAAALAGRTVDFVLLLSSNAASLGGLGYVTYAAANAFMDAFAQSRSRTCPGVWLSAGWDPWPVETKVHAVQTALDRYAMSREESVEAFGRLVGSGLDGMVAVATGDFALRLDRWVRRCEAGSAPAVHARPALRGAYVAPRDELEASIAALWREVLGLEDIGIHDSFFDLGGHSLLATRLLARMREQLDADLSLQRFFETPTVAQLAAAVAAARQPAADDAAHEILAQLMALSEEAAEQELGRMSGPQDGEAPG